MSEADAGVILAKDGLPYMDVSHLGGSVINPLHELMRAIVLRTIEDYNSSGELHDEAVEYMASPEDEYIFSFRFICAQLGLDPDGVREYVQNTNRRISTRRRAA
jgi:hypothetical protein